MMGEVYLDNAATTKVDKKVVEEMLPFLKESYGNPSSMHNMGIAAKNAVKRSRKKVADILNCDSEEIIFTGSGTESDNLAIFGFLKGKKGHIITTKIEHDAVLYPFERLEKEGFDVTFLDVDGDGLISLDAFQAAICKDTIFASIIHANNEIGTVQDISGIAKICKEKGVILHTDACQATSYLEMDTKKLGVDMMTINGSKIYGPKGIGVLYKKKKIDIEPMILGGGQEFDLRSGTENVANIVGFAKALELVMENKTEEVRRITVLRDRLIEDLLKIEETKLNGHRNRRLPNNVNISYLNIEGESILLLLNEEGIYASTGSACSSASLEPSHVIVALGLPHELGHASIRFSLGKDTTEEDVNYVLEKMPIIVNRLRQMSPLRKTMDEVLNNG